MPRFCLTLVSLLAVLVAASGFTQTTEPPDIQRPPSLAPSPQSRLAEEPRAAGGEAIISGESIDLNEATEERPVVSLRDFLGYRYMTSSLNWIPGGGDQFGMFSIAWDHYTNAGIKNGIGVGMDFNFLAGPVQTDMPPRVYDFSIAYQLRERLGPLAFDVAASVMASSDFEGSARKGIRFPAHAVGFLDAGEATNVVFGIDYLDRGDIGLLPVAGLIWIPNSDMRFELVFPRPRAVFRLTDRNCLYLAGELGGGTWAIEHGGVGNDVATYRELRACVGVEYLEKDGQRSAFEIGYLFDRRLEFFSGVGDMHLDDAVMLRLVTMF